MMLIRKKTSDAHRNSALQAVLSSLPKHVAVDPNTELEVLQLRIERLRTLSESLLGIELTSRATVDSELNALRRRQAQLKLTQRTGMVYHRLDIEPLKWRDDNERPRLVIFSLDSPVFELEVKLFPGIQRTQWISRPVLPPLLLDCYRDVFLRMDAKATSESKTLKLRCTFQGVIPADIRHRIRQHQGAYEAMFIIAEPSGFTLEETAVVQPNRDPLVVGFDGHDLWLIADFETTSVEDAMFFFPPRAVE